MPQPLKNRRRDLEEAENSVALRPGRSARQRLICGFGCPCCGPPTSSPVDAVPAPHIDVQEVRRPEPSERRSLAARSAATDGDRDTHYVDTHVHLEMVLQKARWYQSAPSLLEARWEELNDNEQRCWKALGFTAWTWHGDFTNRSSRKGNNPLWFRRWEGLSDVQQSAAQALGWDDKMWNEYEWPLPRDVPWDGLNEAVQGHLATLGETPTSWDDMFFPVTKKPAGYVFGGDFRRWYELSREEREAATELGFSPQTWNMEEMADIHAYVHDFCGTGFDACIAQGCDGESLDDCVKLALSHPQVFAALGCHPKNAWQYYDDNLEERILAAFQACGAKAIAWGEFGLDFSNPNWYDDPDYRSNQFEIFERQLILAIKKSLPLTLHIREAAEEALTILQKWVPKSWKGHIHGYHGPSEFVEAILDYFPNFCFGLTGTVTMGLDGDGARMARILPVDRIMLETDGPYMLPRGTVFNHVGQIPLIARWVAKIKGCEAAAVLRKARENTRFVYGI